MTVKLTYNDASNVTIRYVKSVVYSGEREYTITCFGNEPVTHRGVLRIEIDFLILEQDIDNADTIRPDLHHRLRLRCFDDYPLVLSRYEVKTWILTIKHYGSHQKRPTLRCCRYSARPADCQLLVVTKFVNRASQQFVRESQIILLRKQLRNIVKQFSSLTAAVRSFGDCPQKWTKIVEDKT